MGEIDPLNKHAYEQEVNIDGKANSPLDTMTVARDKG